MKEKNIFHQIPAGDSLPEEINVIIEISKGSRVKYEMNKDFGIIEVDRILKTPIDYPFSYGLIPQTWNEYDNDPLDAIVISSESLMPGCLVKCRVVGMLGVDDSGERDDKVLAVPLGEFPEIKDVDDIKEIEREQMQYFLEHYKDLEKKKVTVNKWENKGITEEFISECTEYYKDKFGK